MPPRSPKAMDAFHRQCFFCGAETAGHMMRQDGKSLACCDNCVEGPLAHFLTLIPEDVEYATVVAFWDRLENAFWAVMRQRVEAHNRAGNSDE